MPITVACPECNSRLTAPDSSAGKRVKCPKCQTPMLLPEAEPEFEVVDEPASRKRAMARPRDEDDEDAPRRRHRPRDDDDEDDDEPQSKRRRDDDEDDEDDRPRRAASQRRKRRGIPGMPEGSTWNDLRDVAKRQRILLLCVAAYLTLVAVQFLFPQNFGSSLRFPD